MTSVILVAVGILLCVMGSAFFSASEMSYSSANLKRLEKAAEDGSRRAKVALWIEERFERALSTILIGNNLVNIAASSLASVLVILLLGEDTSLSWLSTVIITVLVIIFGETMPKIVAKKNANRLAERFSYPLRGLMFLFSPIVWVVIKLLELLTKPLKGEVDDEDEAVEELQSIIETAEDEDVLDEDQSELVQAAIEFSDSSASDVMTARVDMDAIDIEDDFDDIWDQIEASTHSRIPVYEDGVDNIIGVLVLNRFLKAMSEDPEVDLRALLIPPCYVYKTMKLPDVLEHLRTAKQHLAIVSDEYGGTLGVITMEDVLEDLVGEIWDETDTVEEEVVLRTDGKYELDGDMNLDDFVELAGLDEKKFEADSETLGGWTIELANHYPEVGDVFTYEDLKLTVLSMDGRRVDKVLVERLPKPVEPDDE